MMGNILSLKNLQAPELTDPLHKEPVGVWVMVGAPPAKYNDGTMIR